VAVTITLTLDVGLQAHNLVTKNLASPLEPKEGVVFVTNGRL
jgi:hypothetical protein